MLAPQLISAEQFLDERFDLPDGGRWTELLLGRLVMLSAPEEAHATAVFNLGKALGAFLQREPTGSVCFDLGFIVHRDPDTVRFPAISFFQTMDRFAQCDDIATEQRPFLVVELASSNDRRRGMSERVKAWLNWGVKIVWVLDPLAAEAHQFRTDSAEQNLKADQKLSGWGPLAGFQISADDLFRLPDWPR